MAFKLYDEDGYAGDLASIEGYGELTEACQSGKFPKLQSMLQKGMTLDPKGVTTDLQHLLFSGTVTDKSVRDTIVNFQSLMLKESKKEIVIIGE